MNSLNETRNFKRFSSTSYGLNHYLIQKLGGLLPPKMPEMEASIQDISGLYLKKRNQLLIWVSPFRIRFARHHYGC